MAAPPVQTEPPMWPLNFLQNLSRYVFTSGNPFGPGHHLDLNGPIALDRPGTRIRAVAFAEDPELGLIDTPHGRLGFLQVVGLTGEEYAVINRWDAGRLLNLLRTRNPLLVTDLDRASLTDDPAGAAAIDDGARRDGSSTGALFAQEASYRVGGGTPVVRFGASAAPRIALALAGRLPFGRELTVSGPEGGVRFRPGERFAISGPESGYLDVVVPADVAERLVAVLRPVAGTHALPGLTVEIVRSVIRDQAGVVVEEIG